MRSALNGQEVHPVTSIARLIFWERESGDCSGISCFGGF